MLYLKSSVLVQNISVTTYVVQMDFINARFVKEDGKYIVNVRQGKRVRQCRGNLVRRKYVFGVALGQHPIEEELMDAPLVPILSTCHYSSHQCTTHLLSFPPARRPG